MKRAQLAIATMFLMTAGAIFAQGPGNGKQTGPRDGSGPIHTPGTGGGTGTGSGSGNGRMTGPRDGSGPIHTPGTGGGTGAGQRRGRR